MEVGMKDFMNEGEVDVTAHFRPKKNGRAWRVSYRLALDGMVEVYAHPHERGDTAEDQVLFHGTGPEAVRYVNRRWKTKDTWTGPVRTVAQYTEDRLDGNMNPVRGKARAVFVKRNWWNPDGSPRKSEVVRLDGEAHG